MDEANNNRNEDEVAKDRQREADRLELLEEALNDRASAQSTLSGLSLGHDELAAQFDMLEDVLTGRAKQQSEMPWLTKQVDNRLIARERAKAWLQSNQGGLLGSAFSFYRGIGFSFWIILGAALAGYILGHVCGKFLPVTSLSQLSISISVAALFGITAAVTSSMLRLSGSQR